MVPCAVARRQNGSPATRGLSRALLWRKHTLSGCAGWLHDTRGQRRGGWPGTVVAGRLEDRLRPSRLVQLKAFPFRIYGERRIHPGRGDSQHNRLAATVIPVVALYLTVTSP